MNVIRFVELLFPDMVVGWVHLQLERLKDQLEGLLVYFPQSL